MKWLTGNWGLKIVSLLLAVGLWYYAVGEEEVGMTRRIPLEIKVQNPQISIMKAPASMVQVTLAAPRSLLSALASEKIHAVHVIKPDVKTAGDYTFRLEPGEIKLPSSQIRVLKIEPETVRVTLDEVITKKIKVNPQFLGEPAFGYKVTKEEIQLDPNAVLIEGPKGQLEKLEGADTEPIDLVGRMRPFRRNIVLKLPDNVKSLSEKLIDAYVPIHEEFAEKNFEQVPVKILESKDENDLSVEIEPAAVSFVLKGSKRLLEKLSFDTLLVYVDISGQGEGEHELPVKMVLPEEVTLKDEGPVLVKIKMKKP